LLDELMFVVACRFGRVEPRRRARAFVFGLLAELPRKNCWTIAEHAGDRSPDGMQHLLARAKWDAGGVRDDVRGYVVEHLGDPGAVLVVDETGDVKKGTATVAVARQYSGTAGRVENCQVAVYLTYATVAGYALIDRELYLPRSWAGDLGRRQAAGIPPEVGFATKPALARRMIARALAAGVPAGWVTGDEVYGTDPGLRADLEKRQAGYVLAVAKSHRVTTAAGPVRADALAAVLPPRAWQRLSAGAGAKGHRWYDWAWVGIEPGRPGWHWLLIRRNRRTRELAYYRCHAPGHVPLAVLVRVAGIRWSTEMVFTQLAKRAVRPLGGGWQHVADLDVAVGDDHPVDEQFSQQPALLEGGGGQSGADGLAECLDTVGDGLQFQPLSGGGVQLALPGRQGGAAAVQLVPLALEFGQGDDLGQVGVEQPLLLAVQLAQGLADGRLPGVEFLGQPGAAARPV